MVVETPTPKKVEPKKPTWEIRDRVYKLKGSKRPLSYMLKTWITGSVGAATSALDAMEIHMLSERCLVTQGANNFMLMK